MSKDSCAIQRARMQREDWIERLVEKRFDALDALFMSTDMTESEYREKCAEIQQWARVQYQIEEVL